MDDRVKLILIKDEAFRELLRGELGTFRPGVLVLEVLEVISYALDVHSLIARDDRGVKYRLESQPDSRILWRDGSTVYRALNPDVTRGRETP